MNDLNESPSSPRMPDWVRRVIHWELHTWPWRRGTWR